MVQVSLRGLLLAVILSCCLVLLGDVALQLLLQFWEAIEPYIRWYAYFSVAYAIVGSLISLFLVRKPKVLHAIPYLIVDPAVCGECKECRRSGGAYCERHPFRTGVTGHGLPLDRSSGGASVLRTFSPPGAFVLGQKLPPQGESSPLSGALVLG